MGDRNSFYWRAAHDGRHRRERNDLQARADAAETRVAELEALVCAECNQTLPEFEHVDRGIPDGIYCGACHDELISARTDYCSLLHVEEVEAELEQAVGRLAVVREMCEEYVGMTCDDDHQLGQVDAYDAILATLDAPVEVTRVTVGDVGVNYVELDECDPGNIKPGDTLLLVKV